MEQNFFEPEAGYETDGNVLLKQKWSSISAPLSVSENGGGGFFECNICLDSAHDPVVTLCGHLYCWPCIYKWLHVRTSSLDADEQHQNCPVCKGNISITSLVPLYGRGISSESESESKKHNLGVVVPSRPHPSVLNTSFTSSNTSTRHRTQRLHSDFFQSQASSFHNPQYLATSSLSGMATISFFNPLIGMFGGMTLERIFGGSNTSLFRYPTHHPLLVSNNPRIRRQEMELDKSLNRVSIFLFCCLILCLLLF